MESPPDNERNQARGGKRKRPPKTEPPHLGLFPNHGSPVDGNWRRSRTVQRPDESVSAAGDGFDVARLVGGIAQGPPEPINGGVEAMIEVDKRAVAPDFGEQLLARHQFTGLFEEGQQDLEGLAGQPDSTAIFEEFAGRGVHFKWTES
jgi:hypothetical protein